MQTDFDYLRARIARARVRGVFTVSINVVALCGNLTRTAEVRQTKSGMAVASFGIAVNERRKNPFSGEWEDYANFFDVTMFGKYAESVAPKLTKGTKVALNGSLRYSQWEKDGAKRSKVEVIADNVEFVTQPKQQAETLLYDEEIPF